MKSQNNCAHDSDTWLKCLGDLGLSLTENRENRCRLTFCFVVPFRAAHAPRCATAFRRIEKPGGVVGVGTASTLHSQMFGGGVSFILLALRHTSTPPRYGDDLQTAWAIGRNRRAWLHGLGGFAFIGVFVSVLRRRKRK